MTEKWLPIIGYEGFYSVSNQGRVRSETRLVGHNRGGLKRLPERILKTSCTRKRGKGRRYPQVTLWKNNIENRIRVSYLVMESFVGPRPPGMEVLHWDDDPTNGKLANLRYGTHAENKADEVRNSTHCRSGKHPWTTETTYFRPDTGTRICRACTRDRERERKAA